MSEAKLAFTVHHKGRKYSAGTSAAQIGAVASEIGDHAWVGGCRPRLASGCGDPSASTPAGSPPGSMSALGTPPTPAEVAETSVAAAQAAAGPPDEAGEGASGSDAPGGTARRSSGRRGGGSGG